MEVLVPDAVQESLAALSRYFVGDWSMVDTLSRVCKAAVQAIPAASLAGLSMTVDARVGTYVFTDARAAEIDRGQYESGEGPCVDAFRTGFVHSVPSTTTSSVYPEFCALARVHGIGSVLSLPLRAGSELAGALNLYARQEGAFGDTDLEAGGLFACQAAFVLLNAKAYWDARTVSDNLAQAMASRAEIEQAKGIIMGSTGVSADVAFELLKQQSQHLNRKLRDIAIDIVSDATRGVDTHTHTDGARGLGSPGGG